MEGRNVRGFIVGVEVGSGSEQTCSTRVVYVYAQSIPGFLEIRAGKMQNIVRNKIEEIPHANSAHGIHKDDVTPREYSGLGNMSYQHRQQKHHI